MNGPCPCPSHICIQIVSIIQSTQSTTFGIVVTKSKPVIPRKLASANQCATTQRKNEQQINEIFVKDETQSRFQNKVAVNLKNKQI